MITLNVKVRQFNQQVCSNDVLSKTLFGDDYQYFNILSKL